MRRFLTEWQHWTLIWNADESGEAVLLYAIDSSQRVLDGGLFMRYVAGVSTFQQLTQAADIEARRLLSETETVQ